MCLAAYLASPFLAVRQFRNAALAADVDGLDATVDFPAVRESLKSQITVALTAKMANDPEPSLHADECKGFAKEKAGRAGGSRQPSWPACVAMP